mmetsp:Transcript_2977/g.5246  ORF Transcript_2977/g.5246 Transcript_2977/m.5246 type:complete len:291 (+) Transcript_2977:418-1290(+)
MRAEAPMAPVNSKAMDIEGSATATHRHANTSSVDSTAPTMHLRQAWRWDSMRANESVPYVVKAWSDDTTITPTASGATAMVSRLSDWWRRRGVERVGRRELRRRRRRSWRARRRSRGGWRRSRRSARRRRRGSGRRPRRRRGRRRRSSARRTPRGPRRSGRSGRRRSRRSSSPRRASSTPAPTPEAAPRTTPRHRAPVRTRSPQWRAGPTRATPRPRRSCRKRSATTSPARSASPRVSYPSPAAVTRLPRSSANGATGSSASFPCLNYRTGPCTSSPPCSPSSWSSSTPS